MRMRRLFQSILLRYMVSYALIMALLFVGVGFYMNNTVTSTIRTNTIENNINKLNQIRLQNEEKLTTLFNIANQISLSPSIKPFQFEEEPWNAYQIQQQLKPYSLTNDFIDQLYLIFNEDHYLYSSSTSMELDRLLYEWVRFEQYTPEEMRALIRGEETLYILPSQGVVSILSDGSNNRMVILLVSLGMGNRVNIGKVIFMIRESTYQQMFADEIHEPGNTYIFYHDAVLAASREIGIPDDMVTGALGDYKDTVVVDLSFDSVPYLLIAQRGQKHAMQYVTVIPMETIYETINRAQLTFSLFLLALSIPCIALTFYFARRHTKPIKELRHFFGDDTPSGDDFKAIQTGIEALVGRNVDLNSQLDESLPSRKADFVTHFVNGRYPSREQAIDAALKLGMGIDKQYYAVSLAGMPPEGGGVPDMQALFTSHGREVTGWGVELVALEQYLFVLFSDDLGALDTWVWRLQNEAVQTGALAAVSVSNPAFDFTKASDAYLEAGTAYDNRFVMGIANVLRFGDVSAAAKDVVPFSRNYLEGFRNALRSGDTQALNDRIDDLFHYLGNTQLSLFSFRMIYNNVIGALLSEHYNRQGDSVDTAQYFDVFSLSNCRSINDLDLILRKLCNTILAQKQADTPQAHPVIQSAIAFMRDHYTDPMLSMSAVADAHGISAAKLSVEFKAYSGMSPSDYLLLLRMEKAKELLGSTKRPIKDIGVEVGYLDASGFIRRFKKYVGVTPAQYRQNIPRQGKPADPQQASEMYGSQPD